MFFYFSFQCVPISLQCQEAELLKHLAERREHEREVAQKALTKERQEHRADADKEQRWIHLNASQVRMQVLLSPPDTISVKYVSKQTIVCVSQDKHSVEVRMSWRSRGFWVFEDRHVI